MGAACGRRRNLEGDERPWPTATSFDTELLRVDPGGSLWSFKEGPEGVKDTELKLTNLSSGNVAFRVQTSSPKSYYISPGSGQLRAHNTVVVKVVPVSGGTKESLTDSFRILSTATSSRHFSRDDWTRASKKSIHEHCIDAIGEMGKKLTTPLPVRLKQQEEQKVEQTAADVQRKNEETAANTEQVPRPLPESQQEQKGEQNAADDRSKSEETAAPAKQVPKHASGSQKSPAELVPKPASESQQQSSSNSLGPRLPSRLQAPLAADVVPDKAPESPSVVVPSELSAPVVSKGGCRNCWRKKGAMICQKCRKAKYCSAECQRSHWPAHKPLCGKDKMQLAGVWNNLFMSCQSAGGDLSCLRNFVQHVGGDFSYSQNGYRIFHASIMISAVLRQFPSDDVRLQFKALLQDALTLGADINDKCSTGDTAMHLACRDGTDEARVIVDFLLRQRHLDLNLKNGEGLKAEDVCRTPELRTALAQHTFGPELAATIAGS